jgi:hypothetical protein
VAAHIIDSMAEFLDPGEEEVAPETFVTAYITAWAEYYRTHTRYVLAMAEIWVNFRDSGGRRRFGSATQARELATLGDRYRCYAARHRRLVPLVW